jgi:uncharacterized LabA/DUF88 family protein
MVKFYGEERIALFIDGVNSHVTARELGFDIDYRKLYNLFAKQACLVRAFYYTPLYEEQQNFSPLRPLIDWLDYNGYSMVTRTVRDYGPSEGAARPVKRQNMDLEIAVDMLEASRYLTHVVLFSGSGQFSRLVAAVQRQGARVTVVSTVRTQPPMISDELRRQADNFLDLEQIRDKIMRDSDESNPLPPQGGDHYASHEGDYEEE